MSLRQPILATLALGTLLLAGCGFHLRQSAQLPAGMQRVHLDVDGGGDLQRSLARAITVAGSTVEEHSGPGIAELRVPVARFRTDVLTTTGYSRVGEYAVRYHVEFDATDADGKTLVARQGVDMSREFTYDARQTIGSDTQDEEIRRSLVDDMVQSILFRLQAAAEHPAANAAGAP